MANKQKLELTWIGKEIRPKLEPRILLEDPAKSYHARHRVTSADFFDNRLIFGDNLLARAAMGAVSRANCPSGKVTGYGSQARICGVNVLEW